MRVDRRRWLVTASATLFAGGLVLPRRVRAAGPSGTVDEANEALVRELRAGAVLLLRHSQTTPGVGDPPGWKLDDCASQRNLSPEGIEQARRIGRWFEARGLAPHAVRNSPWCRTRETARLAFGRHDDWPALANIFEDRRSADAQASEVRRYVANISAGRLVVLVSHGSTIGHIFPAAAGLAQGEAALLRAGAEPKSISRLLVP